MLTFWLTAEGWSWFPLRGNFFLSYSFAVFHLLRDWKTRSTWTAISHNIQSATSRHWRALRRGDSLLGKLHIETQTIRQNDPRQAHNKNNARTKTVSHITLIFFFFFFLQIASLHELANENFNRPVFWILSPKPLKKKKKKPNFTFLLGKTNHKVKPEGLGFLDYGCPNLISVKNKNRIILDFIENLRYNIW